MRQFGLIGEHLPHSFSGKYFDAKFERENITDASFALYELPTIEALDDLLAQTPALQGFSVTIPYKQQIMPRLASLSAEAKAIGAVNCVKVKTDEAGKLSLKGYNTDAIGFRESLLEFLGDYRPAKALILGTGGASKAVEYVLRELSIEYKLVSRTASERCLSYEQLEDEIMEENELIVNCTPLGTYPKIEGAPELPYKAIDSRHFLYDLVYNPPLTQFLARGEARRAKICNGEKMLALQAEAAWKIWNDKNE